MEGEKVKPLSELLSPEKLEEMISALTHEIEMMRGVNQCHLEECKRLEKENEKLKEQSSQDGFKIIELETALKIKDNAMQNVTVRLHETRNEIQIVLDSPLTDFNELHYVISDILRRS